jgi:hypothetical protein
MNRRVAPVLIGIAIVSTFFYNFMVYFVTLPNGVQTIVRGTVNLGPVPLGVPQVLNGFMTLNGGLWLMLTLFAAVPLLSSTLERGWLELTFAKGTARWKVYFGRFLGGVTLYFLTLIIAVVPLALRLWWATGIPTWSVLVGVGIQTFGFAAVLSVAALASLPQKGISLPLIASIAVWSFSDVLLTREASLYASIPEWARTVLDWAYYVLPKNPEINYLSGNLITNFQVSTWWPLWTTGLFTMVLLGLTLLLVQRKSF